MVRNNFFIVIEKIKSLMIHFLEKLNSGKKNIKKIKNFLDDNIDKSEL
jgi:hypothetical protein